MIFRVLCALVCLVVPLSCLCAAAQSLRLSVNVITGCTEPEDLGTFHHGRAQSVRLSANLIMEAHKA